MLEGTKDPDMIDLLQDIIESCEAGSPRAYLLMDDLAEMQDEMQYAEDINTGNRRVPDWDRVIDDPRAASILLNI
jgi:hypothetical protein